MLAVFTTLSGERLIVALLSSVALSALPALAVLPRRYLQGRVWLEPEIDIVLASSSNHFRFEAGLFVFDIALLGAEHDLVACIHEGTNCHQILAERADRHICVLGLL